MPLIALIFLLALWFSAGFLAAMMLGKWIAQKDDEIRRQLREHEILVGLQEASSLLKPQAD